MGSDRGMRGGGRGRGNVRGDRMDGGNASTRGRGRGGDRDGNNAMSGIGGRGRGRGSDRDTRYYNQYQPGDYKDGGKDHRVNNHQNQSDHDPQSNSNSKVDGSPMMKKNPIPSFDTMKVTEGIVMKPMRSRQGTGV